MIEIAVGVAIGGLVAVVVGKEVTKYIEGVRHARYCRERDRKWDEQIALKRSRTSQADKAPG